MFTWDLLKAKINLSKHGVSFEEAATVFADSNGLEWEDLAHSESERRFKRAGLPIGRRVLILVYTFRRTADDNETMRIVSARHASRKERKAYSG